MALSFFWLEPIIGFGKCFAPSFEEEPTYILYSEKLDGYYTGHTNNIFNRLSQHNGGKSVFTARANDWKLVYQKEFLTRQRAATHEKRIKKIGAPGFATNVSEEEACRGIVPRSGTKPGDLNATPRQAMKKFYYVYILRSEFDPKRHYTGLTVHLRERIQKHNRGEVPHTSKYTPWQLKVAISFEERQRAAAFEKYLKTHSGRVFAERHF